MTTPTPEQIEAAAQALWYHGANTGTWHWHQVTEDTRERYRAEATATLTAAAPFIQAAALRDAADALESHWAYGCELKHDGSEDRAIASAVQMTHENAEELRARADQLEKGQS